MSKINAGFLPQSSIKELRVAAFKFYLDLAKEESKEKLSELGCTSVEVKHSGEGGPGRVKNIMLTGWVKNIIFTPAVDVEGVKDSPFGVGYVHSKFNRTTKEWDYVVAETPGDLTLLVKDFCYKSLLAAGNTDYLHGNGGGETFLINMQTGAVKLAHYKNSVNQEYSNFSIDSQTGEILYEAPEEDADIAEATPATPSA